MHPEHSLSDALDKFRASGWEVPCMQTMVDEIDEPLPVSVDLDRTALQERFRSHS